MAGEAEITLRDTYVLVHVQGDPLLAREIELTLLKATEQANDSNLDIIIFREAPVKQHASVIDFYYYAQSVRKSGFRKKLAVVFPEEMHHDNLDFFVTASRNQGINIRLFSSMEPALTWIDREKGDSPSMTAFPSP